jgi:hypothetical protein
MIISGIDEQMVFPDCEMCCEEGVKNTFWVFGRLLSTRDIDEVVSSSDSSDITSYVFLDRNLNGAKCVKNEVFRPTHVIFSFAERHEQVIRNEMTDEDYLCHVLNIANTVHCNREHVFKREAPMFAKVYKALLRFSHVEGVKWE